MTALGRILVDTNVVSEMIQPQMHVAVQKWFDGTDNEVLHLADRQGDDFSRPRDVDFAFKTSDRERAEDLAEYINGKNFGIATTRTDEGGLHSVQVIVHMPVTQHVLCCVSAFMLCLSRLFLVHYDGWGSVSQGAPKS